MTAPMGLPYRQSCDAGEGAGRSCAPYRDLMELHLPGAEQSLPTGNGVQGCHTPAVASTPSPRGGRALVKMPPAYKPRRPPPPPSGPRLCEGVRRLPCVFRNPWMWPSEGWGLGTDRLLLV